MKKIFKLLNYRLEILLLLFAVFFGFIFRIYGLDKNYSFWTDESSTARFGKAVLNTGVPKTNGYLSDAYFVTHYLTGFSFLLFGENEFSARLPEVIFGTLLIVAVYFFGKKIFNKSVGIASGLFVSFSYIQIAWSRQARGYTILEFFFILYLALFYLALKNNNKYYKIFSVLCLILSVFTHTLGFSLVIISVLFLLLRQNFKKINLKLIIVLLAFFLLIIFIFPIGKTFLAFLFIEVLPNLSNGQNHISYYHSLFWRNYPLFVFLSIFGLFVLWTKKENKLVLFFLTIFSVYIFEIVFLLTVPFEKYALVLFPIIFMLSSYSIFEITQLFFKNKKSIIFFYFFIFFIIFNGDKFTLKPKKYYSLNYNMREIPEIDFKRFYDLVENKVVGIGFEDVAIIDIEEDNPAWYLGENKHFYNPRKGSEGKIKSNSVGAEYIYNFDGFLKVIEKHKYGFVLLVEHDFRFYPEGMVEYARKNLKLELKEHTASFSPPWNYWPAELYSWGFNPPSQ